MKTLTALFCWLVVLVLIVATGRTMKPGKGRDRFVTLASLVALVILVAALTACGPFVSRAQPNRPPAAQPTNLINVSSTVTCTGPVDAQSGRGPLATIRYDAIDDTGAATSRVGPGYPFEVIRATPFTHGHYYEPGLIITLTVTAFCTGEPGEIVGCYFTDNGVQQVDPPAVAVASIQPGRTQAGVFCSYTTPYRS